MSSALGALSSDPIPIPSSSSVDHSGSSPPQSMNNTASSASSPPPPALTSALNGRTLTPIQTRRLSESEANALLEQYRRGRSIGEGLMITGAVFGGIAASVAVACLIIPTLPFIGLTILVILLFLSIVLAFTLPLAIASCTLYPEVIEVTRNWYAFAFSSQTLTIVGITCGALLGVAAVFACVGACLENHYRNKIVELQASFQA